jgi:flap endonuclease-1
MAGRSIRVTPEMMEDAKKLVKLMGAPVIQAPCEAEAQCAKIVSMGLAFGTATEDMDALTFGTNYLLRGFNGKKEPICQIDLALVLEGFAMTQAEFIDLCIMCGCDYTHTISGMGPVTAYKMIKEHGDIEGVLEKVKELNEDRDPAKK